MRVSFPYPFGFTGSEVVNRMRLYIARPEYTPENLPNPTVDVPASTGFYFAMPLVNAPFWLTMEYEGTDGQKSYSPSRAVTEFSPTMKTIFGTAAAYTGDAVNGRASSYTGSGNSVNCSMLNTAGNVSFAWDHPTVGPRLYYVDKELVGAFDSPSKLNTSVVELYQAGYMGTSGDYTDTWPNEVFEVVGNPVEQGRTYTGTNITWSARIPTLDDFIKYLGVIYLSGIETSTPPISALALSAARYYITSTPWPDDPAMLTAVCGDGTTKGVLPNASVTALLLMTYTVN